MDINLADNQIYISRDLIYGISSAWIAPPIPSYWKRFCINFVSAKISLAKDISTIISLTKDISSKISHKRCLLQNLSQKISNEFEQNVPLNNLEAAWDVKNQVFWCLRLHFIFILQFPLLVGLPEKIWNFFHQRIPLSCGKTCSR